MSSAQICPVVGTTTTVLPPGHPKAQELKTDAVCPVTLAKVGHHEQVIQNHPTSGAIPASADQASDARACPALKNATEQSEVINATCPVVGPVSTFLPPDHPTLAGLESGKTCPKTNATMAHHKDAVHVHPAVPAGASIKQCPIAGNAVA